MIESLPLSGVGGHPAHGIDFTAVEIRTTGLRPGHIVELAAVRTRLDGTIVGEFTTSINPGRGVPPGSAFVHGLDRGELDDSPPFGAVLGPLLDLCGGSVLVAHNLPFVDGFLSGEVARLGVRVPVLPGICTLAAAQTAVRLPNYRLSTVAHAFGVPVRVAQPALTGARAIARLVTALFGRHGFEFAVVPALPAVPRFPAGGRLRPRAGEPNVEQSWMADVVERVTMGPIGGDPGLGYAYLDLLAGVVADAHLTHEEVWALAALATEAGIPEAQVRATHEQFVMSLRDVAEGDGVVTIEEAGELQQVATALGVAEVLGDVRPSGVGKPTRVLVLGSTAAADQLRARILAEGAQLAKKLTSTVTHLIRDETVPAQEPRLARAVELGAVVLGVQEAATVLGFESASVERAVEPQRVTRSAPVPVQPVAVPRPPVTRQVPSTSPVFTAPPVERAVASAPGRRGRLVGGRILMGVGLLLMLVVVLAMFGGTPLAAGIFVAVLGVGALLGGWWIATPSPS
ncbi:3'-5' exonuclease [Amycolatopsis vastitatis]|uniref:DNA polymerase III subunit epsilon n=1 Tax=Amycolatopsis vastitatis TaxID=1905142 RepID=A0A229TJS0_9PSEU|nr:3'-5' exonuclease [Amycolatopsis vastitatis]OXM71191.1 DNA polymerase III subunit epsilon [Amycolatopsis vastitatis]